MATAAGSHSSTKAVVITVVQGSATIGPGALSHLTMIEIRNGATVLVSRVCPHGRGGGQVGNLAHDSKSMVISSLK